MVKKIIVVSLVACFAFVNMACSDDAEDACEHIKEKCSADANLSKQDCSKANDEYDKLPDAQKEQADKMKDCIMDAESCDAIKTCIQQAAGGGG